MTTSALPEPTWRVTVRRWSNDEWGSESEWVLDKLVDGAWKPARRDDPADVKAFAAVDEMDPLRWPVGESFFNLQGATDA